MRNIAAVASGTAAAQVVVVAFSPVITRIYSPETFGLQGVFLSLVSILSPVIALRYPLAIITAETWDEALRLGRLSLMVAVGVAGLMWLILLTGGQIAVSLLGAEGLGSLILFLPLALLCVTLQDVANFKAARQGVFRLVGLVSVLQAFVTNVARIVGGLISPVAAVLVAITTLAPAIKAAMLMAGARDLRRPASGLTRGETLNLLNKHRDFPVYRMPTDVLNSASQAVPVLMLAALFTPAAAGLYVLTRTVLNLPSNVIGAAVGNVIYARFAELSRQKQPLYPLLWRATGALLLLSPLIIGLALVAPSFFAVVFGEEWREAGHYAQWMALWLGVSIANVPAIRLAPVIKSQGLLLIANILFLIVRVAAIFGTASAGGNAMTAVAVFSIVSLFLNILLIFLLFINCIKFDRDSSVLS